MLVDSALLRWSFFYPTYTSRRMGNVCTAIVSQDFLYLMLLPSFSFFPFVTLIIPYCTEYS
jgi:hypothetical protein